MVIISNLIGIETDFNFEFLFGFYFAFILWNLKYALFLDFFVIKLPFNLLLINILYQNGHKLWVTTIWFCDNFSFEINNWRLKDKLGFYCIARKVWRVVNFNRFLYKHWNVEFVNSSLLWVKLKLKIVNFLRFYHQSEFFVLILIFLNNLFFLRFAVLKFFLINI